jgi:hypothetical protein
MGKVLDSAGIDVPETADHCSVDYEMEGQGDLLLCPGCVELNDVNEVCDVFCLVPGCCRSFSAS